MSFLADGQNYSVYYISVHRFVTVMPSLLPIVSQYAIID
jgi:hypothetical protein